MLKIFYTFVLGEVIEGAYSVLSALPKIFGEVDDEEAEDVCNAIVKFPTTISEEAVPG